MSMLADDSVVMEKTRELCASIVGHPDFGMLQERVGEFLGDDAARQQFQSVQERGRELHQKQHAGIELSDREMDDWEAAREELMRNELVRSFVEARGQLESLQRAIGKYVGMTLELGRVPEAEDFSAEEGCCGGHGGCGCGCEH
jgi:cell fate (sporulation/competence/biofilm development) regulator YlbF (YheA/YmcA/DUF963 family)